VRLVFDYNLDATVVGATFGAGVVSDWSSLSQSVGLDEVALVASLHQVATNRVRPTL
jgi:hypothetical protein